MTRALCAGLLTLGLLAVLAGPAQAARCPAHTTTWKVGSKTRCLPVPPAATAGATKSASALAISRAVGALTTETRLGRRKVRRVPPPVARRLRAALPRMQTAATTMQTRLLAAAPPAPAAMRSFSLLRAAAPVASETMSVGPGVTLSGGVSVAPDGSPTISLGLDISAVGYVVNIRLAIRPAFDAKTDMCPDAEGRVNSKSTSSEKVTTSVSKGGRRLSSSTITGGVTTDTVAHVGPDGMLSGFDVTVTDHYANNQSAFQLTVDTAVKLTATADGPFTLVGRPRIDLRLRAGSLSREQERELEPGLAEAYADSNPSVGSAITAANAIRAHVKRESVRWTSLDDNKCITVKWNPDSGATMQPNDERDVQGTIAGKQGQAVDSMSRWQIVKVLNGTFTGGTDGRFHAVGGNFAPNLSDFTVYADVIAASRSGRVETLWNATGTLLPVTIAGTVTQTEVDAVGDTFRYTIAATWQRPNAPVKPDPDGVRRMLFTQVSATVSHWSYDTSGASGCTYHGEGSGGTAVDGDVEIDLGPDGTVDYGFTSELDLGSPPITLVSGGGSCPASATADNLRAFVQARRQPDSGLYRAPAGAIDQYGNFAISATGVTDTIASTALRPATADWSLTGSAP